MQGLLTVCRALTVGLLLGVALGGVKYARRRAPTQAQVEKSLWLWHKLSVVFTFVTFLLLGLGLVWCVYFLCLGLLMPQQAEYANNMSELIVGVLTVISIMFAFYEFLRRK